LDTPTPPPKRLTTLPIRRIKPQPQPTPWQEPASGRKTLPTKAELEAEAAKAKAKAEAAKAKANPIESSKPDFNASSFPKNVIYYEDSKPVIDTLMVDEVTNFENGSYCIKRAAVRKEYEANGVSGTTLRRKEKEHHLQKKIDRGTLLLHYILSLIDQTISPISEPEPIRNFHLYKKQKFPQKEHKTHQYHQITKEEKTDIHYYRTNNLAQNDNPPKPTDFNADLGKITNCRAYIIDSDGIDFDEFISTRDKFQPLKITSTVDGLNPFFHSASSWLNGVEKLLGIIHPNAEAAEFSGFNNTISSREIKSNVWLTAIGYGEQLPPAYRTKVIRDQQEDLKPSAEFINHFAEEILIKLRNSLSSKCNDLMENIENPPHPPSTTTYCENQSISAYISKLKRPPSILQSVCEKLEPSSIKDLFTNNNFITLYRVKKIDETYITIKKEPFKEGGEKLLGVKLDKMISLLAD
jgi:hypothetical protein